jgi:pyrroline-5-carboxylate reductase
MESSMDTLKSSYELKVVIVGPGKMGIGAAKRLLETKAVAEKNLLLIGRRLSIPDKFNSQYRHVKYREGYAAGKLEADAVILAVKPKDLPTACEQLKDHLNPATVVISFVAAVKTSELESLLGSRPVVRAMPNIAFQVGESYTRWTANTLVDNDRLKLITTLLSYFGMQERVETDNEIDVHTIISGTGIAIIMYVFRAFIRAAVYLGVRHADAHKIIYQVAHGGLVLMKDGIYDNPEHLIDEVTTPAGTTTRALKIMDGKGISAVITDALESAYDHIQKLARK